MLRYIYRARKFRQTTGNYMKFKIFTTVSKLQLYRIYCPVILCTDRKVSGDTDASIFRVECSFTHLP